MKHKLHVSNKHEYLGMSKSLSWTDGDPSTSTPTHPSHQRRSSPCPSPSSPSSLGGIISPPPPSLR